MKSIKKSYVDEQVKQEIIYRFSDRGRRRLRLKRFALSISWSVLIQIFKGAKRLADFTLAIVLLVVLTPVIILTLVYSSSAGGPVCRTRRIGRWCIAFYEYSFNLPATKFGKLLKRIGFNRLPTLLNILRGDMSFIGPRPVSEGELTPRTRTSRRRYDVRPGLICLWWIRQRANVNYGVEAESDAEYVENHSMLGDIGIAFRSIPATLYGRSIQIAPDEVSILGVRVNNLTMDEAIENIVLRLNHPGQSQFCFVNADCANITYRDHQYLQVLNQSWLTFADGIGMKIAGKLLAREIKQNVNGTDLFPRLCSAIEGTGKRLFLLGAKPGVADLVRDWIAEHYPRVTVCGDRHGYFNSEEESKVIDEIARSRADILLVAFGAPRQDVWISEHLEKTGAKVAMGVGGLFDFYSGQMPRAPQWMREIGLEWVFRFYQEPRRMWKRYFVGNAVFLFRVIKEKVKG